MPRIFISYRRDDTDMAAGRLAKDLRTQFGDAAVFRDKESIPIGADWMEEIREAIGPGGVLLVLIGEDWLKADAQGKRRLDDPEDPHRNEIAAAFKLGATVVPVLVRNQTMPRKEDLPEELRRLPQLNAIKLRDDEWDGFDFPRLAKLLEGLGFKPVAPAPQPGAEAGLKLSKKAIASVVIGVLVLGALSEAASDKDQALGAVLFALLGLGLGIAGFLEVKARKARGQVPAMIGTGVSAVMLLSSGVMMLRSDPAPDPMDVPTAPAPQSVNASDPAQQSEPPASVAPAPLPRTFIADTGVQPERRASAPAAQPHAALQDGEEGAADPVASGSDLSGVWTDQEDGTRIEIQQQREGLVLGATSADGVPIGGIGTISGDSIEVIWSAAGIPVATSTLKLAANGSEIRGTSRTVDGETHNTVWRRGASLR